MHRVKSALCIELKRFMHRVKALYKEFPVIWCAVWEKNYLTGNSLYCAVKRFNWMHKAL